MARSYDVERSTARQFAQSIGITVLLIGIIGLVLGDARRLIVFNIDIVEDIVHLLTGGVLVYIGFVNRDNALARSVVGIVGVVYLLVGILGFIAPNLFGLLPNGYNIWDNLLHLGIGLASIVVAWFLDRR